MINSRGTSGGGGRPKLANVTTDSPRGGGTDFGGGGGGGCFGGVVGAAVCPSAGLGPGGSLRRSGRGSRGRAFCGGRSVGGAAGEVYLAVRFKRV